MEMALRQQRDTTENKDAELNDLLTRFKSVSQQLHCERQSIERKNQEIHNAEGVIQELTQEQRRIAIARNRETLDAQRVIGEKERELKEKVTICESLEAEVLQKEREINELHNMLEREREITEAHKTQQNHTEQKSERGELPSLQERLNSNYQVEKQAVGTSEDKEDELEILQAKLKRMSQELHSQMQITERKTQEIHHAERMLKEEMDQERRRMIELKDEEYQKTQTTFQKKEMILQQRISALEAELLEKEKKLNKKDSEVTEVHKQHGNVVKQCEKCEAKVAPVQNPTTKPIGQAMSKNRATKEAKPKRIPVQSKEAFISEDRNNYGAFRVHCITHSRLAYV